VKYAVETGLDAMTYLPSFIQIDSDIKKMKGGIQLCFGLCHYEGPGNPDETEIKWDTSAVGLC
jgi:hypothetical protein